MTIDEAIQFCTETAADYMGEAMQYNDCDEWEWVHKCANEEYAANYRQLAEWLTELKEWKENPFWQIKTECKKNYDCNNCAFLNHCPFAHGNSVAAEYPMDWIVY